MEIGTYHSMELLSCLFALWHTVYGYSVLLSSVITDSTANLQPLRCTFYFSLKVLTNVGYNYWSSTDTSSLTVTNESHFHFTLQ